MKQIMPPQLARATTFEEVVTRELEEARERGDDLEKAIAARDSLVTSLRDQLEDAEARVRAQASRCDALHRDKARIEERASALFEDYIATRRELDKVRLQLEYSVAKVGEAQLERDRSQSNLAKVTNCLAECQISLSELRSRDAAYLTELNELRTLVDAHQEEVQVITEARRHVQGLCEELQRENERLQREGDQRHAQAPQPSERPNRPVRNLVNVPR